LNQANIRMDELMEIAENKLRSIGYFDDRTPQEKVKEKQFWKNKARRKR